MPLTVHGGHGISEVTNTIGISYLLVAYWISYLVFPTFMAIEKDQVLIKPEYWGFGRLERM